MWPRQPHASKTCRDGLSRPEGQGPEVHKKGSWKMAEGGQTVAGAQGYAAPPRLHQPHHHPDPRILTWGLTDEGESADVPTSGLTLSAHQSLHFPKRGCFQRYSSFNGRASNLRGSGSWWRLRASGSRPPHIRLNETVKSVSSQGQVRTSKSPSVILTGRI